MAAESFDFSKYWGRIVAVPSIFLVFGLNLAGLNLSATDIGLYSNVIGLVVLTSTFLLATWRYSSQHEKTLRYVFIVTVVLMQAFLGSALHDYFVINDMIDIFDDVSFALIIPCLLVAAQLWGWAFDLVRLRSLNRGAEVR